MPGEKKSKFHSSAILGKVVFPDFVTKAEEELMDVKSSVKVSAGEVPPFPLDYAKLCQEETLTLPELSTSLGNRRNLKVLSTYKKKTLNLSSHVLTGSSRNDLHKYFILSGMIGSLSNFKYLNYSILYILRA